MSRLGDYCYPGWTRWTALVWLLGSSPSVTWGDTPRDFARDVVPFLRTYCLECHSGDAAEGGVALDQFTTDSHIQAEYALWDRVSRAVGDGRMPPREAEQPSPAERAECMSGIGRELSAFDCRKAQRAPFVTLRRLNRDEYNRTIRDLLGLDFQPAADFPSDDVGYGFDNIADVLSVSPLLMEKYLEGAEQIVDRAFADPQAKSKILVHPIENDADAPSIYRRNLLEFAARAYRRPLGEAEEQSLTQLGRTTVESGLPVDDVLKTVCTAILTSPHFLFRVEEGLAVPPEAAGPLPAGIGWLDDWTLASRLSYFLWSSMPDTELLRLARERKLHDPIHLQQQVARLLADPKSSAFVSNFAGQWLQLRSLPARSPDPERFPTFNPALRQAMQEETERFFAGILRENRNILEFLTADYSYVNGPLAQHYGIAQVEGDAFQKVALPAERRGVLTHASVLLVTSNPTRTSPVKRGKWILENILGEPPPPPPPDVPPFDEAGDELGSLRERMEQHRANPACAVCHDQMDTLGFGLENFSAIGAWRDRDGRHPIRAEGVLPGNLTFENSAQLSELLAEHRRGAFSRCLTEKLLIYALGRGLQPADRCSVDAILQELPQHGYQFRWLITAVVLSEPFRTGPLQQ